jgi:ATP-dependent DNA ligase
LDAACGAKAEGIVSKRVNAAYAPGDRGLWRKSKCYDRKEFVIVGYTEPEGSRPHLGALLVADYDDAGQLLYAGRAGTGMSGAELPLIGDAAAASRLQNAAERTTAAHNAIWISAHPLSCPLGAAGAGVRSEVPDLDRARRACRGALRSL